MKIMPIQRVPVAAIGASLAMVFLCSCTSAVYDMRQLQQPVVLNGNPFLAPATPSTLKMTKVDTYTAMVDRGQMAASAGDTTIQEAIVDNQAQFRRLADN